MDDDIEQAAQLIPSHVVRRLPAVQDGPVVSVVSLGDLVIDRDERSALADISAAEPKHLTTRVTPGTPSRCAGHHTSA